MDLVAYTLQELMNNGLQASESSVSRARQQTFSRADLDHYCNNRRVNGVEGFDTFASSANTTSQPDSSF